MPTLSFRVTPEEALAIRNQARGANSSVAAFIRSRVLEKHISRRRKLVEKKHPVSGLCYDATNEGGPTVSLEEIKAALADFP